MPRTQGTLWLLFLGEMGCLGLFYACLRENSVGLLVVSVLLTAGFGIASLFLSCPACGGRTPLFSREAWDIFSPRWKCRDCGHEL